MSNRVTIQIYGNRYNITTTEDPAYVYQLAGEIDKTVTDLMRNTTGISLNEAMVLVALSCLDGQKKSEQSADNLRRQITDYASEAAKARARLAEAERKEKEKDPNKKPESATGKE